MSGSGSRREREREQRRQDILDAAEAVFFERGADATIEAIAARAGIAKGTVYLSFASKEDLYMLLIERGLGMLVDRFREALAAGGSAVERITRVGEAYFRFYREQPDYFRLLNESTLPIARAQLSEEVLAAVRRASDSAWMLMIGMLRDGIDEGVLRKDIPAFDMALMLWSSATGVLRQIDMMQAMDLSREEETPFAMRNVDIARLYSTSLELMVSALRTPRLAEGSGNV